jgi:hypothetical protein
MTFSIMTLSLNGLFATISIRDTQHNGTQNNNTQHWVPLCWVLRFIYCYAECRYADCHYAECRGALVFVVTPPKEPRLLSTTNVRVKFFGGILQFEIWYHFSHILPAVTFSKVVTFWMDSTPIQQYNYSELQ